MVRSRGATAPKKGMQVGMVAQAKSLSKETFHVKTAPFSSQAEPGQVSITLMVAGRDSYRDQDNYTDTTLQCTVLISP